MTREFYSKFSDIFILVFYHASNLKFVQVLDGWGKVLKNQGTLDLLVKDLYAKFVTFTVLSCFYHIRY